MGFGASLGPIEDLAEPIRAWRCWQIHATGFLYASAMTALVWDPGGITAACFCVSLNKLSCAHEVAPGPPPAPHPHNFGSGCGLYAVRTLSQVDEWLPTPIFPSPVFASGEVLLGGKVWEHETGWRAQYGRVASLRPASTWRTWLTKCCTYWHSGLYSGPYRNGPYLSRYDAQDVRRGYALDLLRRLEWAGEVYGVPVEDVDELRAEAER